MATEDDDWRAQRAAQLAGTPFARPSLLSRERIDDTLPIGRTEPTVSLRPPKPRPPSPPATGGGGQPNAAAAPSVTKLLLPVAAALAVIVAVVIWLAGSREKPRSPVVVSIVPAPAAAIAPARVASPHVASAPGASALVAPAAAIAAATPGPLTADPTIIPIAAPRVGARAAAIAAAASANAPAVHRTAPAAAARATGKPSTRHPAVAPVLPVITISVPACSPKASRIDAAICASPTLTAFDREMRQLSAAIDTDGDPRLIAKAQKGHTGFLKKRDRCKDDACLSKAYSHRVIALQKLHKKAVVAEARAREMALPICDKGVTPLSTTCRPAHRRFSLKRLFGG